MITFEDVKNTFAESGYILKEEVNAGNPTWHMCEEAEDNDDDAYMEFWIYDGELRTYMHNVNLCEGDFKLFETIKDLLLVRKMELAA